MATYTAADGSTRKFDLNQALRFAAVKEYQTGRDAFGPRFACIPGGEQLARIDDGTWVWMDSGNTSGRSEPWREISLGDADRWFGCQRWTFRWRGPVGAFGVEHRCIGVPDELVEDLDRAAEQPATAPEPAPRVADILAKAIEVHREHHPRASIQRRYLEMLAEPPHRVEYETLAEHAHGDEQTEQSAIRRLVAELNKFLDTQEMGIAIHAASGEVCAIVAKSSRNVART